MIADPSEQGAKAPVRAPHAIASASHPRVTAAMRDVLADGGNALDAVATAVLAQGVVEPQMASIAGGFQLLYFEAATGQYSVIDADLDHTAVGAPIANSWDQYVGIQAAIGETSGRRVAVPGVIAGVHAATERWGTLPWEQYFVPAIELATDGFPMYSFLYGELVAASNGRLSAFASGRAEFLPLGYPPPVGELFRRPELGETLSRLASDGPDHFYRGPWARAFVREVNATGGLITTDDLDHYRARISSPLRSTYRGATIVGAPPPSTGGVMIALILNILEEFDLKAMGHYSRSVRSLEVIRRAFAYGEFFTERFVKDPLSFDVPLSTLLSQEFAQMLAATIDESASLGGSPAEAVMRRDERSGPSRDVHSTDTDHLSAVDRDGNFATMTHSVYGTTFGTGLVVEGVHVNSGNGFPGTGSGQGRRILSPVPPTIVEFDGVPRIALGSPGLAARAVAIVLINALGYEMDLQDAIDAPRFQGSQVDQPFVVEPRIDPSVLADLSSQYGADVRLSPPYYWHFGSLHAVRVDDDGHRVGYNDPRRPGSSAGC